MKRIFSILLITAMLVALTPMMGTVALAEEYATVTSENGYGVRLREGPSKAYGVIRTYSVGTTVVVLQTGTEWSQLKIGETVGWMQNKYLNFGTVGPAGTSSSEITGIGDIVVTSGNGLRVWLRTAPSGTRIDLYAPGTPATLIEYGTTWCYISINGTLGYMMTEFLMPASSGSAGGGSSTPVASGKIEYVKLNYPYPVVGDVLEIGEIKPEAATVKYSWKVNGVEMGTEPTFSVLSRYYNQIITLDVTGIGECTGTARATALAPVQLYNVIKSVKLDKVAPVVGDEVKALLQPSSATVEYSWRVAGVEVSNDATYTVQESDIGKLIQLKVTGAGTYEGTAACSAEAYVVSDKELQKVELNKYYPVVGETVSAKVYPEGANVKYTWTVDGEVVSNAATYQVQRLQLGKQLRVTVEGVDPYTGTVTDITKRISGAEITSVTLDNTTPIVGDKLSAYLVPASASAKYTWYADGVEITGQNEYILEITPTMADKKISVKAVGIGTYSGEVESTVTSPVITRVPLKGVELSTYTPVVGDVIEVARILHDYKYEGALDEDDYKSLSYVWYIDNQVAPNHDYKYTVTAEDVGKVIRVKAVGKQASPSNAMYSGEVYSTYTNAVQEKIQLGTLALYNKTTEQNAQYYSPEKGDTLKAIISPNPDHATVKYEWYIGNELRSTSAEYTIEDYARFTGQHVRLTVTGTGSYEGTLTNYTAAIIDPVKTDIDIKNFAAPEAGKTPVTSGSIKDVCNYSIEWLMPLGTEYKQAELDQYGNFLPGKEYTAKITITPINYVVLGEIKVYGSTPDKMENGNIVYETFGATADQQITDYYISELPRPVAGETAVTHIETTQYTLDIAWETDDVNAGNYVHQVTYVADITLKGKTGYTVAGLGANVFTVNTADSTESGLPSGDTVKVTATFKNEEPTLKAIADKTDVYLDGYNSRLVTFNLEAENFSGNLSDVAYDWTIIDPVVDGTKLSPVDATTAQLTIGMYETADRVIRVRVQGDLDGDGTIQDREISTIPIQLISGSDMDTAIKVEFTKAPVQLAWGATGEFEVKVSNSTKGYELHVFKPDNSHVEITNTCKFTVPNPFEGTQIVVKAFSVEDPSVIASVVVLIHETDTLIPREGEEELLGEMIIVDELVVEDEAVVEELPVEEAPVVEEIVEEVPAEPTIEIVEETPVVEETTEEVPAEPTIEIVEETPVVEETTEEVPAEPTIEIVEETPVVEETTEEVPAEPTIEIVEETPVVEETTEEVPAEPTIEIVEETPVVEETTEEVPAEPTIEIVEETPVVEETTEEVPAEPTIEITEPVEEVPAVEEEVLTDVVIEIKDTVTGEVVVEEEPAVEEPVVEETEEEPLTGVVIEIKDTVTGEVVEEQTEEEEPVVEEKTEEKKSSKTEKAEAEEPAEEEAEEEIDPELDDLEGDKDVGESAAESLIKIRFVEMVSEIKRGNTAQFSVETEGTEQGVRWSVRLSKNAEGKKVSSIGEDGVLAVSREETAEKLVVVATSIEDGTVRARWIVTVKNPASKTTKKAEETEAIEEVEVEEIEIEETIVEEPEAEEVEEETTEFVPESEGLSEEQLRQIEEELKLLEQQNSVLDNF